MVVPVFSHPQVQVISVPVVFRRGIVCVFFCGRLHDGVVPCFKFSNLLLRYPFCRGQVVLMDHFLYQLQHLPVPCEALLILHAVPEIAFYVHHAFLMVAAIAVERRLVVMDQDSAKNLHRRPPDSSMPFTFPCKVHGRPPIAAYDDVAVAAVRPCRCAVHMHDRRVQERLEEAVLFGPALEGELPAQAAYHPCGWPQRPVRDVRDEPGRLLQGHIAPAVQQEEDGLHGFLIVHVVCHPRRERGVYLPAFLFVVEFLGLVLGNHRHHRNPYHLPANSAACRHISGSVLESFFRLYLHNPVRLQGLPRMVGMPWLGPRLLPALFPVVRNLLAVYAL